jgi:signal transduction histidine kinase
LAISKGIVERHKGTIRVESELGRGTTFHIFLALDASASVEEAAAAVQRAGAERGS